MKDIYSLMKMVIRSNTMNKNSYEILRITVQISPERNIRIEYLMIP